MEDLAKYNEQDGAVTIKPRFRIGDKVYYFSSYEGEVSISADRVQTIEIGYSARKQEGQSTTICFEDESFESKHSSGEIKQEVSIKYGFGFARVRGDSCFASKEEAVEALKAFAEKTLGKSE